jgi:hypothetical protein
MIAAVFVVKSAPGMSRREKATAQVESPAGATTKMLFRLRLQNPLGYMNALLYRYDEWERSGTPECAFPWSLQRKIRASASQT